VLSLSKRGTGLGLLRSWGEHKGGPKTIVKCVMRRGLFHLNKVSKLKLNTVIKVLKRHPPIFIAVQFSKHLHRDVSVKLFGHRFIKKLMEVLDRDVTFVMAAHQFP
jgi:hypothetical protein